MFISVMAISSLNNLDRQVRGLYFVEKNTAGLPVLSKFRKLAILAP
jgi:hypothetical protein